MNERDRLQQILLNSPIALVLPEIAQLHLPDWWLAGGSVRNTVWRSLFPNDCTLVINDFDIAFFDLTGDRSQEQTAKSVLTAQFPDYKFDVKNQASFAHWRTGRRPYYSTEDGVSDWLHTATAIGVRINDQGEWEFFTPYGLSDLLEGIVRPTPAHLNNPDAVRKANSFFEHCTVLRSAVIE